MAEACERRCGEVDSHSCREGLGGSTDGAGNLSAWAMVQLQKQALDEAASDAAVVTDAAAITIAVATTVTAAAELG